MESIWSNTDFPYMCLKDEKRTKLFRKAIRETVKKNDIVIDVGSGTGILSFFAAKAGAKKVYAVEIETHLARCLRESIKANGFENIIEVVEGDAKKVSLPKNADVIISELIDTGLFDELQVPVLNHLRHIGIIGHKTTIIPRQYKTFLDLVRTNNLYYGYKIMSPKHEWPFYEHRHTGWLQTRTVTVSNKVEVDFYDFMKNKTEEYINKIITFNLPNGKKANAIRLSGLIYLTNNIVIGPTNALNGDKIFPINPVSSSRVRVRIKGGMGQGLINLSLAILDKV